MGHIGTLILLLLVWDHGVQSLEAMVGGGRVGSSVSELGAGRGVIVWIEVGYLELVFGIFSVWDIGNVIV